MLAFANTACQLQTYNLEGTTPMIDTLRDGADHHVGLA